MSDGVVDESEKEKILTFCKEFTERPIKNPVLQDEMYNKEFMQNGGPVLPRGISAIVSP